MNILLIGMMGCGKSTIGKLISDRLNLNFVDMDNYIEAIAGETIPKLFEKGEDHFRDYETRACKELSMLENTIISAGGGVIKRAENMSYFKDNTKVIFIDRPVDEILKDVDTTGRPLLSKGKDVLLKLKEERYPLYNKYSDVKVDNIDHIDSVVQKIIDIMR